MRPATLPLGLCLILLFSPHIGAVEAPTKRGVTVVLLPPALEGEFVEVDRKVMTQRLALGLNDAGVKVVSGERVARASKPFGPVCEAECPIALAGAFHADAVVMGRIKGQHDNYEIELTVVDGRNGAQSAQVTRHCDICGITELAATVRGAAEDLGRRLQGLAGGEAALGRLEVQTEPAGAVIFIDEKLVGTTPRTIELAAGEHDVLVEAAGHAKTRKKVTVEAGEQAKLRITLQRDDTGSSGPAWRTIGGWTAVGVGVAAIITGAVLAGIDGNGTDCAPTDNFDEICRGELNTAPAGYAALGLGVVAASAGAMLLLWGRGGAESAAVPPGGEGVESVSGPSAMLLPSLTGMTLSGSF